MTKRFFGIIKDMAGFFRKRKIVAKLRVISRDLDKEDSDGLTMEEKTGQSPNCPEHLFLGTMVEKRLWGIPNKCLRGKWKKKWIKQRKNRDRELLRELANEEGSPIFRTTIEELNKPIIDKYNKSIKSNSMFPDFVDPHPYEGDNRIQIGVIKPTYANWSETLVRFSKTHYAIYVIILAVIGAIWKSNILLIVKNSMIDKLCDVIKICL